MIGLSYNPSRLEFHAYRIGAFMRDVWFRLIGEPYELCYHLKLFEIFDKFGIHLLEENYVRMCVRLPVYCDLIRTEEQLLLLVVFRSWCCGCCVFCSRHCFFPFCSRHCFSPFCSRHCFSPFCSRHCFSPFCSRHCFSPF